MTRIQEPTFSRRELLKLGATAPALAALACSQEVDADDGWDRGDLQHLLPTASHDAFNLKVSFRTARADAPTLAVGERRVAGEQQDSHGRFWAFRVGELQPATEYALQLRDGHVRPLSDPWPLSTFPAPGAAPDRMRLVSYTCAGGPDLPVLPGGTHAFKPAAYRRRLFDRMLAEQPDAVVANGDHVYWDYESWGQGSDRALVRLAAGLFLSLYGSFDATAPVLGSSNEDSLVAIGDDQIAGPYGVRFRSTPVFFVTDDHDYFDNDDATPERVTFPPNVFHRELRDTLQRLYFPELIAGSELPEAFPGLSRPAGVPLSAYFGELRFGDLLSAPLYDCGGFLGLDEGAGLVPPEVEAWLLDRTREEDTRHLLHIPSHPMGRTAGKWREWYPDVLRSSGSVVAAVGRDAEGGKYLWQEGWWQQHQRLVGALSAQRRRRAVVASGDLHELGAYRIERSGALDLSANPVFALLCGPPGVGDVGWPSAARGVQPGFPEALRVSELLPGEERNGYCVLDYTRDRCDVRLMRCPAGYVEPARLDVSPARAFAII